MKFVLILIVSLSFSLISTAQQYDLKLNLKKGQHYKQSIITGLDMVMNVASQNFGIKTKIQFDFDQKVKAITSTGDFILESSYSHISISSDFMGQHTSYDSNNKDATGNETYATAFKKLLGKKIMITLSPKGKVLEVAGLKELMNSLEFASIDPIAIKTIKGAFNEDKIVSTYKSLYDIFPDKPISISDSWNQKKSIESMIPVELTTKHTLIEVSNGFAKIKEEGDLKMTGGEVEVSGGKVKSDVSGKYSGIYTLDIGTGLVNESSISMPIKGTMDGMGKNVPVSANTTTQTTTTPLH